MKESVGKKIIQVWIDLGHTPQYNFYKNFIIRLAKEGHTVYVTVLNRGRMPQIVKQELSSYSTVKIYIVGKHRLTKWSAILEANLLRIIKLFFWSSNKHIDIGYSNGYLNAFIGRIRNFDAFTFDDDPHTFSYKPKILFSKQSHYCLYELPEEYNLSPKVKILPVLKEWAYLAPNVFTPNVKALERYMLEPKEYLFLREVSVGTVNYAKQTEGAILNVMSLIPKNKKILLSLEDKSNRGMYPKDWILLQEPLEDIHSLIYYSCGLVSSGDSMAREATLLGIPSYYLGVRNYMPANIAASKLGNMHNLQTMAFNEWIYQFENETNNYNKEQEKTREKIGNLFIDINEYLYSFVDLLVKKKK